MLKSDQTRQMIRDFGREPLGIAAAVGKCVAGIAMVAGIAVIGVQSNDAVAAEREDLGAKRPQVSRTQNQKADEKRAERSDSSWGISARPGTPPAQYTPAPPSAALIEAYRATVDFAE